MRKSHLNVVIVSVHSGVRPYEINVMYVVVFECENILNTLLRHKIVRTRSFELLFFNTLEHKEHKQINRYAEYLKNIVKDPIEIYQLSEPLLWV